MSTYTDAMEDYIASRGGLRLAYYASSKEAEAQEKRKRYEERKKRVASTNKKEKSRRTKVPCSHVKPSSSLDQDMENLRKMQAESVRKNSFWNNPSQEKISTFGDHYGFVE